MRLYEEFGFEVAHRLPDVPHSHEYRLRNTHIELRVPKPRCGL